MNKENPKKNKKSFEYYIAQRKEEFRCQYDHERSWENLQYKLQKRKNHRLSLYCVAASAAFLFLILGVSHIFSLHNNTQNKEAVVAAVVSCPETGSRKAILTLENGEKVDLSVKKGTISNANSTVINNNANQLLTYRKVEEVSSTPQINTLAIPRGGEYQLILSDGTRIWMNAESLLRYPTSFIGEKREVFLEGEAFFEVAKDAKHPFIVHTNRHSVEVLGTSFNISAYPDYKVYTTLAEGRIKVSTTKVSVVLNPDQQAVIELNNDDIVTRDVPAYLFTSWAKGNYEFRNTSLSEIVAQLSRWYNVDIYFKNESLKDKRFAGIIFRDEELNFAIEVIERVSNVHFTREGETIYIEDKHE